MFCDRVADLDAAERARYADLLVLIAAADGELVREEIQLLESFMGIAMVHPEARTSIRQGLFDTNRLSNLLKNANIETLRYALRDGVLLAAREGHRTGEVVRARWFTLRMNHFMISTGTFKP